MLEFRGNITNKTRNDGKSSFLVIITTTKRRITTSSLQLLRQEKTTKRSCLKKRICLQTKSRERRRSIKSDDNVLYLKDSRTSCVLSHEVVAAGHDHGVVAAGHDDAVVNLLLLVLLAVGGL